VARGRSRRRGGVLGDRFRATKVAPTTRPVPLVSGRHVEGTGVGAEPARRGDRLESGNAGASTKVVAAAACRRRHQHRHERPIAWHRSAPLVAGHRRLAAQHVHALGPVMRGTSVMTARYAARREARTTSRRGPAELGHQGAPSGSCATSAPSGTAPCTPGRRRRRGRASATTLQPAAAIGPHRESAQRRPRRLHAHGDALFDEAPGTSARAPRDVRRGRSRRGTAMVNAVIAFRACEDHQDSRRCAATLSRDARTLHQRGGRFGGDRAESRTPDLAAAQWRRAAPAARRLDASAITSMRGCGPASRWCG